MAADNKPKSEAIRAQLERILQNAEFRASDKQRKFLSFVVDETLAGRASQLKGYTVAVAVYGRSDNFDPQVDPIVRVEAGRLRRALERYYLTAGKNDPLRIEIPKGSYIATFHTVQIPPSGAQRRASERENSAPAAELSIAVMPLLNLTGDEGQDYFADGLTEELTGEWDRGLTLLKKGMKLNPYHPSWFHLAPFMDAYRRAEYKNALSEALKFNYPELFWDPLVRAVALGRLGRQSEAKAAVGQLLKLEPDFATRGRLLISRYVKVDDLVDTIIEGLRQAGLADIE